MTTYCVWFDNLMEELFALEKTEFDSYEKLQEVLKHEKNVIHVIDADSLKEAYAQYREKQETIPVLSHVLH